MRAPLLDTAQNRAVRHMRVRWTVLRLMIAVALTGIALGLVRVHLAVGILAGLVEVLAFSRTLGAIDHCKAQGQPLSTREKFALIASSLFVAIAIVGVSLVTFSLTVLASASLFGASGFGVLGLLVAVAATLWICTETRKSLWNYRLPERTALRAGQATDESAPV